MTTDDRNIQGIEDNTMRVLEFGKILEMAAVFAVSTEGKALVGRISPLEDINDVRLYIKFISQWRDLLSERKQPGIEPFDNLTEHFAMLKPEDAILEPIQLRQFLPLFDSAINLRRLHTEKSWPMIQSIVSGLTTHPNLRRIIETSIDLDGHITDEASPELATVRRKLVSCANRVKGILERLLKRKELASHIQDDFITERNGRWVIPLKKDSRGQLQGVVHDISKTGETLFIEPYESQPLGNEIESLRAEEKIEEFKVLKRLCTLLRDNLSEIEQDYLTIIHIDAVVAVAVFSDSMRMTPPEINEERFIRINKGRHPVLWKRLKKTNQEAKLVPLDFVLGQKYSSMLITGSNAGGKTVALKTIGVLHLMALSGMHIPAASGTTIPFVSKIFVDIGDEQSIEDNLSTFSGHMYHIADILRKSDANSLVLLDELGSGTDPDEGGSLGSAILRALTERGMLSVITTHLGLLKLFAYTEEDITFGSMEIEVVHNGTATVFRPTYSLTIGEFGRSHAFEIAANCGLPPALIQQAREFMTDSDRKMEYLITDLKRMLKENRKTLSDAEEIKQDAMRLRDDLVGELDRTRSANEEALADTYRKAEEILQGLKAEAKEILLLLQHSDTQRVKGMVINIDKRIAKLRESRKTLQKEKHKDIQKPQHGQRVLLRGFDVEGIILSVNERKSRCTVLINGREVEVPFTELLECEGKPFGSETSLKQGRQNAPDIDKSMDMPRELNLIGQRVDPAMSILERYLNDAAINDLERVKIIHGVSTGRLAGAVREYLKDHPLVKGYRKGNNDEGGEAVTIVTL
ncbi:endonuclease MutS2 [Candidatus Magnetobacterium casense]|uniref:Endonuclease MutS2 n=1 Tax=Candidatus Magnetobacterium casense TaxID=1455061 RepID=A0ABS6RUS5_9BACT|nr:Smr/MutS family protein [Candidatus Magnetobacterium casensis]MBV6340028.1 Smr/MutS family protein [Candidatus Magnetobacterium casensis]